MTGLRYLEVQTRPDLRQCTYNPPASRLGCRTGENVSRICTIGVCHNGQETCNNTYCFRAAHYYNARYLVNGISHESIL